MIKNQWYAILPSKAKKRPNNWGEEAQYGPGGIQKWRRRGRMRY